MCVLSSVRPFVTPWTVAYQAPLLIKLPRQECWSRLPFPTLRDLATQGLNTSPALIGRLFTTVAPNYLIQFSSVQSLSRVRLFATPWTAACQASLSITNFQSLLKLMSIESVMPSNHLILCHPLLLPPSIFPSIEVFSNESVFPIGCIEVSFSISPSSEYS